MRVEITPETIEALRVLRTNVRSDETSEAVAQAIVILDNAGIFASVDEATRYDTDPERVSKCTCQHATGMDGSTPHNPGCPAGYAQV